MTIPRVITICELFSSPRFTKHHDGRYNAIRFCLALFVILCTQSSAAPPSELTALQQQYKKTVLAPAETAKAELAAKFIVALGNAITTAKQAGKLDEVLALQDDQKRLTDNHPLPDDDDKTPQTLKKLRTIYRDQLAKLEAQRTANHTALLPAYTTKLKDLEATLTKADRIEEAKEVKAYRESLGSSIAPSPVTAHSTKGVKAGKVIVWQLKGGPVDPKQSLVAGMPSAKEKVRELASPLNNRARYVLAVLDNGKVHGWPSNHGGVTQLPASLKHIEHAACGYTGSVVLDSTGKLSAFSSPEKFNPKERFNSVSCGSFHVLCLTPEGTLHGFALDKRAGAAANIPADIGPCISAWAGDNNSLVLKKDGTAWLWSTDQAPIRVEQDDIRSVHWAYRTGTAVLKDGTCRNISTTGKTGPLPDVSDTVPEGGGIVSDGEGHHAIWSPTFDWKFYGKDLNAEHCAKEAKGCIQVIFMGDYGFGIQLE